MHLHLVSKTCAWHPEHNKNENVMQYIFGGSNPTILKEFNEFMKHQRLNSKTWIDVYPLDLSPVANENDFFVDIGGGVGHMCSAFLTACPQVPGRVILQDLPSTISSLQTSDKRYPFALIPHNYLTPQPIKKRPLLLFPQYHA